MRLTIGRKIIIGFGLPLLFIGVIGIVSHRSTSHLIENAGWVSHTYKVLEDLDRALTVVVDAESGSRGYIITGDEHYLVQYSGAGTQLVAARKQLRSLTSDNQVQQKNLDRLEPLVGEKLKILREMVELRRQNGAAAAIKLLLNDQGRQTMVSIRSIISAMQDEENQLLRERDQQAGASAQNSLTVIVYGSLLGFVLIAITGFLVYRSVMRPLAEFSKFVSSVGDGDLRQRSSVSGNDELGDFAQSLNKMVSSLKDVTAQTRTATQDLNSAAAEILVSAKRQAASTGEQAAAVQQTSVTMQEISQSGFQIAERAKQVAAMAQATAAASDSGLTAVENTNRTMDAIRKQAEAVAENVVALSEKTQVVGEIIATVNDISEQSHLLALNAAIEAAAAGEHGRTFAVVASEIKNLANQSKEATIQVRSILGDIQKGINSSVLLTEEAVKRVESGREQADVAAGTIREMTGSIQQSVQAFQQIVAGTNQQQIGFDQVMQAVREIGKASDQTASSTRELEKASTNLMALGQQLGKAMERYQI
jgi:methyl-accepting chemotaxis protein